MPFVLIGDDDEPLFSGAHGSLVGFTIKSITINVNAIEEMLPEVTVGGNTRVAHGSTTPIGIDDGGVGAHGSTGAGTGLHGSTGAPPHAELFNGAAEAVVPSPIDNKSSMAL